MRISLIISIIFSALIFSIPAYSYYTITLKNGEELQAEEYKFEGQKISLKLKTGSAAFPRMLVKAIAGTGAQGSVNMTGSSSAPEPAPAQPQPKSAAPAPPPAPAPPAQDNAATPAQPPAALPQEEGLTGAGEDGDADVLPDEEDDFTDTEDDSGDDSAIDDEGASPDEGSAE